MSDDTGLAGSLVFGKEGLSMNSPDMLDVRRGPEQNTFLNLVVELGRIQTI